ncbi:MAG: mitochondrial 37S ribosomal protein nam9 [Thelocarpon superellum]|nr:MAG: mitochondrial 37S ribosomal protein nam9 [Thelocarpon superellum]
MRKRFHGLKRIKLRQSWNKFNLYNISRSTTPPLGAKNFFQQKWLAKSSTRAYHGEQVREKQWQRMFRPHMASVVPMSHVYLARNDGSEQAAGRGSGLNVAEARAKKRLPKIPYTNMVYAPIERRLDTAIFRALFASSTRQARQFVVHGSVSVNGKKMIYPGYLLNPGDMFQVDPERVLFATGVPKDRRERRAGRVAARKSKDRQVANASAEGADGGDGEGQTADADTSSEPASGDSSAPAVSDPRETLHQLLQQARSALQVSKHELSAKEKQQLRAFQRTARRALQQQGQTASPTNPDAELSELMSKLFSSASTQQPSEVELSLVDQRALQAALREARENPIDSTKPYSTPWRPRPYMSAFAFIPRYLEVNQNVCSAVYLRHPVARPGLAEVPSPFHPDIHQLAFNWYLRRR